jgi:hypothetical protein
VYERGPERTPEEVAAGVLEAASNHAGGELRDDAAVVALAPCALRKHPQEGE